MRNITAGTTVLLDGEAVTITGEEFLRDIIIRSTNASSSGTNLTLDISEAVALRDALDLAINATNMIDYV